MLVNGVHTHVLTSRFAVPLMLKPRRTPGLIVEVTDGWGLGYHGSLFYDLVKTSVNRLAYAMGEETRAYMYLTNP